MIDNHKKDTYKAIVFDMDGVIINSKQHVEAFWLKKLDEYGIHIFRKRSARNGFTDDRPGQR